MPGFNLQKIKKSDKNLRNTGNMGSIVEKIWIAYADDVLNLHLPDVENSDEPLLITQDIEMKAGKRFQTWEFVQGTGKFSSALVGELQGKSQEPAIEFAIPKIDITSQSQLAATQNDDLIVIGKLASGDYVVIGTKEIPALLMEGGADSGTAYADRNHTRFVFKASACFGAYFYAGSLAGLVEGEGIETAHFTTSTASAGTDTVVLNWVDNTGYPDALGTDKVNVSVKNVTKNDTFTRSNVATRADETASIVLFNVSASDVLEVDVWFELAADSTRVSAKKRVNITAGA